MLDLLGGRNVTLSELPRTDDDWYLNLVWIERQKCLLLTHTGTLFSVFRVGVHVADLRPLGDYLVAAIEAELRGEGLPTDTFCYLNHALRRMLWNRGDYVRPIELVNQRLNARR